MKVRELQEEILRLKKETNTVIWHIAIRQGKLLK